MKKIIYIATTTVLTLLACNNNKVQLLNDKAALPASFNFDKMGLKVMASFVNRKAATMSVLYANPLALNQAIANNKLTVPGEVFTLVTWKQQDDGHWFGGRIPGEVQSAEILRTSPVTNGVLTTYQKYTGNNLLAVADTAGQSSRIKYILDQQPSVMP